MLHSSSKVPTSLGLTVFTQFFDVRCNTNYKIKKHSDRVLSIYRCKNFFVRFRVGLALDHIIVSANRGGFNPSSDRYRVEEDIRQSRLEDRWYIPIINIGIELVAAPRGSASVRSP